MVTIGANSVWDLEGGGGGKLYFDSIE